MLDRPRTRIVRLRTSQHVEVVGGVREILAWLHRLQPLPEPVQRGEQRGHGRARRECVRATPTRVNVVHRPEPQRGPEQGQRGPQPGERPGVAGRRSDRGQRGTHLVRQPPQLSGPPGELGALYRVRQFTVDQEMPDVLETAGLREFDRRVLAVVVEALQPPDVTQLGVGDDDARESSRYVDRGGRGPADRHVSSLDLI